MVYILFGQEIILKFKLEDLLDIIVLDIIHFICFNYKIRLCLQEF